MKVAFLLLFTIALFSCQKTETVATLFTRLPDRETGITFANRLTETEADNILTYEYFYNGGGVAVGDFNSDGLQDLFFTGNQVENKLYLNKNNLKFEDISAKAGIGGRPNAWKTGVSLVDINADGWLDIYVCYSGNKPATLRKNQLFVNNQNLTFTEQAEAYGLADTGYTTQTAFFDADDDGDLDAFVLNHNLRDYEHNPDANFMRHKRDDNAGDKLLRNDNGHFTEISPEAGIKSNPLGFGLGLAIADLNGDNQPDIYVGNDYVEDDYLYLNSGKGNFNDVLREKIFHTSRFTMGVEIADINNDTLPDIFTLDMLPEDNFRQKLLTFPDNWNNYQAMLDNGFWHQNMRNMLQLNNGNGTFSEIGQLAGISNTDWSWSPLFADFDNDGRKDLFVSNGELKDLTNADFIKYAADEEMKKASGQANVSVTEQIRKMSASQTRNYIFKNTDGIHFENKQHDWGFDNPTVANGAVCADLDNDGDLEIITNNLNEPARIYKNNSINNTKKPTDKAAPNPHFLKIKLKGSLSNPFGVGTKVLVYAGKVTQYQEFMPVRGFQSCVFDNLHFGLGSSDKTVNVKVVWQDGRQQVFDNIKPDQLLEVSYKNAGNPAPQPLPAAPLFEEKSDILNFTHHENPARDFDRQILLPYQYSYTGSRMASGDVNGDGLPDLYLGGARNQPGRVFLAKNNTQFLPLKTAIALDSAAEDKDAVFFDADGDHDLDLYVVSGDYSLPPNHPDQQDRLYFNDGKGNFKRNKKALPEEFLNGSFIKVLDVDKDGDNDLFVGGTVVPGGFPMADPSFLLLNDGKGNFITAARFALGLVTDAVVADLDKNGFPEVVVVGEWMSPQILWNRNGKLQENTTILLSKSSPVASLNGWWNRIEASDLDNDGDLDFVLGNLGLNCQMKASPAQPLTLTFSDFDKNGSTDPMLCYFIQGISYPASGRDETLEQIVTLRKKFTSYESFSKATLPDMFSENQLATAQNLRIDFTETVMLENTGKDFIVHRLPVEAQFAPIYAISVHDFDGDGKKDLLLAGNNAQFRLRIGKMDANTGMLFSGKGNFKFEYIPQSRSGFHLTGDVKDIKILNDKTAVFFINNQPAKVYKTK